MNHLRLENVKKSFGGKEVVNIPSLEFKKGKIIGLLGPNGAGKTTTIRMIMRIIMPDAGSIEYNNTTISEAHLDSVGYLPEERGLFKKMKVKESIEFFAKLKKMEKSKIQEKSRYYLEAFDLLDYEDKKVEELSRGMQQKLQFIITVLHEPEFIILDEPFTGLDPINTEVLKNMILEENKKGTTIVFSTHMMEKVEQMCEDIILINKGKPVLKGALKKVKRNFKKNKIMINFKGDDAFLKEIPQIVKYEKKEENKYIIQLEENKSPNIVVEKAFQNGQLNEFTILEPTLSSIFIESVNKQSDGGPK